MIRKILQAMKISPQAITAGPCEPAQLESSILRMGFYVTATCIMFLTLLLLLT